MLVDDSRHHTHLDGEHGRGAAVRDEPRQHQSRDNALILECGRRVSCAPPRGEPVTRVDVPPSGCHTAPPSSTPVTLDERGNCSGARRIQALDERPAADDATRRYRQLGRSQSYWRTMAALRQPPAA